jgi:hypothetical protein
MGSIEPQAYFRLKSTRRRKRFRQKEQEKHLLFLHREENKLRRQIRNLGYEPLIPPVQKGYKRIFVLREDVRMGGQGPFFAELLRKINTVQYSDTKAFTRKIRRRGRKVRVPVAQKLRVIYESEWGQGKLTAAEAIYFVPVPVWDRAGEFRTVYEFREPWRFMLRIVPNLISEVRVKDHVLERQVDKIDRYLSFRDRRYRQSRLLGRRVNSNGAAGDRAKYKNPLRKRPVHELLDGWE